MTDQTYPDPADDRHNPPIYWTKGEKHFRATPHPVTGEPVIEELKPADADPFYPLVASLLTLLQAARRDRLDMEDWQMICGEAPALADAIARGMRMTLAEVRGAAARGEIDSRDLYTALSVSIWAPIRTPAQIRRAMLGHIASLVFNAVTAGIVLRLVFPGMPIIMIVSAIVASMGFIWIAVGLFEKRKGGQ